MSGPPTGMTPVAPRPDHPLATVDRDAGVSVELRDGSPPLAVRRHGGVRRRRRHRVLRHRDRGMGRGGDPDRDRGPRRRRGPPRRCRSPSPRRSSRRARSPTSARACGRRRPSCNQWATATAWSCGWRTSAWDRTDRWSIGACPWRSGGTTRPTRRWADRCRARCSASASSTSGPGGRPWWSCRPTRAERLGHELAVFRCRNTTSGGPPSEFGPCAVAVTDLADVADPTSYRPGGGDDAPLSMPGGGSRRPRRAGSRSGTTPSWRRSSWCTAHGPARPMWWRSASRIGSRARGAGRSRCRCRGATTTRAVAGSSATPQAQQPSFSEPGRFGLGYYDSMRSQFPTRGSYVVATLPVTIHPARLTVLWWDRRHARS